MRLEPGFLFGRVVSPQHRIPVRKPPELRDDVAMLLRVLLRRVRAVVAQRWRRLGHQPGERGNGGVVGLMAGDAESTMAGAQRLHGAGKTRAEICIVGNGGTEDQIAAVDAGDLFGVVAFDFEGDLVQNVDELHRLAADPTAEGQRLTVPIRSSGADDRERCEHRMPASATPRRCRRIDVAAVSADAAGTAQVRILRVPP